MPTWKSRHILKYLNLNFLFPHSHAHFRNINNIVVIDDLRSIKHKYVFGFQSIERFLLIYTLTPDGVINRSLSSYIYHYRGHNYTHRFCLVSFVVVSFARKPSISLSMHETGWWALGGTCVNSEMYWTHNVY